MAPPRKKRLVGPDQIFSRPDDGAGGSERRDIHPAIRSERRALSRTRQPDRSQAQRPGQPRSQKGLEALARCTFEHRAEDDRVAIIVSESTRLAGRHATADCKGVGAAADLPSPSRVKGRHRVIGRIAVGIVHPRSVPQQVAHRGPSGSRIGKLRKPA
jgi:hypothetical protein